MFVFLQSAAFGGVFTGFAVARDFDSGFARRLLLSAPRRSGIIAGYAIGALLRWAITGTVVTIAALIAGMNVFGSAGELVGLLGLGIAFNFVAALWGTGLAMFLRTEQAGAVIQMPVFVLLFLAPVYVPLPLLTGWIHDVARLNPGHDRAGGRPRAAGGLAGQGRTRLRAARGQPRRCWRSSRGGAWRRPSERAERAVRDCIGGTGAVHVHGGKNRVLRGPVRLRRARAAGSVS